MRSKLFFLGDVNELLLIFPPQHDKNRIGTRFKAALSNVVLFRLDPLELTSPSFCTSCNERVYITASGGEIDAREISRELLYLSRLDLFLISQLMTQTLSPIVMCGSSPLLPRLERSRTGALHRATMRCYIMTGPKAERSSVYPITSEGLFQ